jgi:hypothetical protein
MIGGKRLKEGGNGSVRLGFSQRNRGKRPHPSALILEKRHQTRHRFF